MLFSNRIRCFVCSFIAFLGFGLNLNTLHADSVISYVVFYKGDYFLCSGRCDRCSKKIKGKCCFIPYETDEPYKFLFGNPVNQICLSCLKKNYLIPHLELLKRTSNDRDDYVQKASTSIIEGSSKYMNQDPDMGRPSCYKCGKQIISMEDDVIDISKDEHVHKICLNLGSNVDNIIRDPESNFKFADSVVNIKALIDKVWPLD